MRQHGVAADFFGAHDEAAAAVERAADDVGALLLGRRHRFAGDHQFIDRGSAFDQHAVDRNFFAGTNAQPIADRDGVERHVFIAAVVSDAPRGFGRERDERADRARGRGAGAQFEHLAEQHQHRDDAGGLEIKRDAAVLIVKRRGKQSGRQRRDDAVAISDAGAHGDQREHVEIARDQRLRAAHEKRPAAPQHHRRRQHKFCISRNVAGQMQKTEMAAHIERHDRQRQQRRNPEAARHVGEFAAIVRAAGLRLERHAADRAGARSDLADFRMHRTGVDRACGRGAPRRRCAMQIFVGIGRELAAAAGRAEVIGLLLVAMAMRAFRRIDLHAAHRIDGRGGGVRMGRMVHGDKFS